MRSAMLAGWAVLSALVVGGVAPSASAQTVTTTTIASGLGRPLYAISPPNDPRLFIVEQRVGTTSTGRIQIYKNGALLAVPFFSIGGLTTGDEQGLLGLAFHPNFAANRRFYINYTDSTGTTNIVEYQASAANADVADATTARTILTYAQPFTNHNGGWMDFGPDGFLYIAAGDGGSANDPGARAQALTNGSNTQFLGKILRIDVDGDDFPTNSGRNYAVPSSNPFWTTSSPPNAGSEIWAYGVRNPWRCSFDKVTGDLWIADVGQDNREEVNFQPAGAAGGRNYGWRCREGFRCTGLSGCTCPNAGYTDPLFDYDHITPIAPVNATGCSITGGFVYRGCRLPWLRGLYLFGDYCGGIVYAYNRDTGVVSTVVSAGSGLTSFGQDNDGELYVILRGSNTTGVTGSVRRLTSASANPNCPCPSDYNEDGFANLDDLGDFITDYYTLPPIPGGRQPNAPQLGTLILGYGIPCASAPNAPAPYSADAYRRYGYRVGYSGDASNACPLAPDQGFPNLDNLGDYITLYYGTPC
jgi:hypothetical protein